jgi:hypothetical protein
MSTAAHLWQSTQASMGVEVAADLSGICVEGLTVLEESLVDNPALDPSGRASARADVVSTIMNWLSHHRALQSYPAFRTIAVEKPLVILAPNRTGSTLLHNLLALDPRIRTPRLWELWYPSPPPRAETYASDPRIAVASRRLEKMKRSVPQLFAAHPMAATSPEDCGWIMCHEPSLALRHCSPDYWDWLTGLGHDALAVLYGQYAAMVQLLQVGHAAQVWVSKSEAQLHFLPLVLEQYPDVRIVRMHRNPCNIVGSKCALFSLLVPGRTAHGDSMLGALALRMFTHGTSQMLACDEAMALDRIVDVVHEDLIRDPRATVCRIYDQLALDYPPSLDAAIARYLREDAPALRSPIKYTLERFGLSAGQVRRACAPYLEWLHDRLDLTIPA